MADPAYFDRHSRFELLGRLGRGGMGSVYLARDHERGVNVALKTVGAVSGEALLRFKREFRAVQDLDHPNLIHLDELFEEDGRWSYTMELVEGSDFRAYVRADVAEPDDATVCDPQSDRFGATDDAAGGASGRRDVLPAKLPGRFDEARLRAALAQLAAGLSAIHGLSQVHRDIKPANVLVTHEGRVVILDFGLVTTLDEGIQKTDVVAVGTIAYMSPEQAAGLSVDERSDWYSVGVLLYQALTGRLPIEGDPMVVVMRKQIADPTPPSNLVSGVPEDLDRLCMALLARDPADRPGREEIGRILGVPTVGVGRASRIFLGASDEVGSFVGRERELASLARELERSRRSESAIVAVVGPAGMGKTTLVQEFLRDARRGCPDLLVVSGRCHEQESTPYKAFDGWMDEFSRHLKRLPAAERSALLPQNVDVLAQAFPVFERLDEVSSRLRPAASVRDPLERRSRLFDAVRTMFQRLAAHVPLVCVIDDLQWTDPDSQMMLAEVFRQPDAPAMLLVSILRPFDGEARSALAQPSNLRARGADVVLTLGPLDVAESTQLVDRLFGDRYANARGTLDRIVAEAGGHPLFLHTLHDYLTSGDATTTIPDLDAALLHQIDRLGGEERRLLEIVAVAGAPVSQEIAAEAARIEPENATRRLKGVRVHRLVRTYGPLRADPVEVAHDRIRDAVLRHIEADAVRAHHLALAEALDRHGGAPSAIVRHWRGAGRDDKASEFALAAAERAEAALAFDRAAAFYAEALELGLLEAGLRRATLLRRGDALSNAGKGVEAAKVFLEAVPGADETAALVLRARSGSELMRNGHFDEGLALLDGVLAEVGSPRPESWWSGLPSLAWHQLTARFRSYELAAAAARAPTQTELVAVDAAYAIMSGFGSVEPVRSLFLQRRHLHGAIATGDRFRIARAMIFETLSLGVEGSRSLERTTRLVERAQAQLGDSDDPRVLGILSMLRGTMAFYNADWIACEEHTAVAIRRFREECVGMFWELSTTEAMWVEALRSAGRWKRFRERAPRLVEDYRERGDRIAESLWSVACPNFVHLLDDDCENGLARGRDGLARWGHTAPYGTVNFGYLYFMPWHHVYLGDAPRAFLELEEGWPSFRASLLFRVQTLRYYGHEVRGITALHAATADPAIAARALGVAEASARGLDAEGHRPARALAALLRAGIDQLGGREARSAQGLEDAADGFRRARMDAYLHATERRLGELLGGDRGATMVEQCDRYMREQGVRNPVRVARVLVPV